MKVGRRRNTPVDARGCLHVAVGSGGRAGGGEGEERRVRERGGGYNQGGESKRARERGENEEGCSSFSLCQRRGVGRGGESESAEDEREGLQGTE